jgi:hypothetical protein
MATFYHGSGGLFTTPDTSMIEDVSSYGKNEYGWGFYASDHGGDAWEYIEGVIAQGKPAFIYTIEIDDETYKNDFLIAHESISSHKLERLIDALETQKENPKALSMAEDYRQRVDEDIRTSEVYHNIRQNAGLRPRAASQLLAKAGFKAYQEGAYIVFMDPQNLPEFGIHSTYNYGRRDAEADYALIKRINRGDKLSDYASEKFQGRVQAMEIRSEMARHGLYQLTRHHAPVSTVEKYLDLIELSEQSDNNGGFHIRDMLGHGVSRAFMIHPRQREDAYFGTNITNLVENFEKYAYDAQQIDGFMDKLREFVEELKEHPTVNYCLSQAPAKPANKKM